MATDASGSETTVVRVVPKPTRITNGDTVLGLSSSFGVRLDDSLKGSVPRDLQRAINDTVSRLRDNRHRYLSVQRGKELLRTSPSSEVSSLVLSLTGKDKPSSIAQDAVRPVEKRPEVERYKLSLPVDGPARIEAGYQYTPHAPYEIEDKPAFGWRAVLLDTSRNWFGIPAIQKMLDSMSLVKLNVFHWHITDSNSWPMDLDDYPELAKNGAYSPEQTYSQKQIQEIIKYAAERGIDVVPEIDMPGHTAIIAESHPEYIAGYLRDPWGKYAHQPPAGQLRFADDKVIEWTSGLLNSAVKIFSSPYFGTGGDELNIACMAEDEPTQKQLKSKGITLEKALDVFTDKTHEVIRAGSKTPLVWQEMVLAHGDLPSVKKDTIVTIWIDSSDAKKVLDKGYRIVHGAADFFYLDQGQGGWIGQEGGGDSWAGHYKTWQKMFSFNPYDKVAEENRHLVMGGQVSLWAEQTDETNFEMVLWPRAAAVAEVFWTGPEKNGVRSSNEAFPRMHDIRYRLVDRGVAAVPLQPYWSALRPGSTNKGDE